MQLELYSKSFAKLFADSDIISQVGDAVSLVRNSNRVIFIGNGGSNAICSHMMEDYMKIAGIPTLAFSDPSLITCFSNDYGYENAIEQWIKFVFQPNDLLIAVSSSGESANITNAAKAHLDKGGELLTLTGFKKGNTLSGMGHINIHVPYDNYGIVECFHQVALHAILDELAS